MDNNEYKLMSNKSQLSRKVVVPMKYVGDNIKSILFDELSKIMDGRCAIEGFVMPGTIDVISYSSGLLEMSNVIFDVVFDCNIVCPVEGMLISCVVENITKAGIKAKIPGDISPLVIFVARDHNFMEHKFKDVKENDNIVIKVIGQRYELNDKYISVIAEISDKPISSVKEKKKSGRPPAKPKLKLKE